MFPHNDSATISVYKNGGGGLLRLFVTLYTLPDRQSQTLTRDMLSPPPRVMVWKQFQSISAFTFCVCLVASFPGSSLRIVPGIDARTGGKAYKSTDLHFFIINAVPVCSSFPPPPSFQAKEYPMTRAPIYGFQVMRKQPFRRKML